MSLLRKTMASASNSSAKPVSALGVFLPLSDQAVQRLRTTFPSTTVHYHPPPFPSTSPLTPDELASLDVVFSKGSSLPPYIRSLDQIPNVRHIQLGSAGADGILASEPIRNWLASPAEKRREVTVASASGTHVLSIPPWVVAQLVTLEHQLHRMAIIARVEQKWSTGEEVDLRGGPYMARSLKGRTVGLLGYGALGRETARLLKAFGMTVIAANTSGKATPQDGYVIPGTGDPDGSLPEAYYAAGDAASLDAFLKRCDVLVASLPGTPRTKWFLDAEKLALLPQDAVFLNIGRGSLIKSEELIKALDSGRLLGAAIDVTDPEPLPQGHPLWTHPRCIVTPHLSGDTEGEFDIATDIAIENLTRLAEGRELVNLIDPEKGY